MPTDKPKIQAYIEPHIYQSLQQYCQDNSLSLSSAIEDLLTLALAKRDNSFIDPLLKRSFKRDNRQDVRLANLERRIRNLENYLGCSHLG